MRSIKEFIKQNAWEKNLYRNGWNLFQADEKFKKYFLMEIEDIKKFAQSIDGNIFLIRVKILIGLILEAKQKFF